MNPIITTYLPIFCMVYVELKTFYNINNDFIFQVFVHVYKEDITK